MLNKILSSLALTGALLASASPVVATIVAKTNGQVGAILQQPSLCGGMVEAIPRNDPRHPDYIAPPVAKSSYVEDPNSIALSLLIGGGFVLAGGGVIGGFALGKKKAEREAKVDAELGDFINEDRI